MIDKLLGNAPIPDLLLRSGAKHLIKGKRNEVRSLFANESKALEHYADSLRKMPVAIETDKANEQHYEVPSEFYKLVLGDYLKYSCCSWQKATNLSEAEKEMLDLYLERAKIKDGNKILDLGCGWGSFSLYCAQKFPNAKITSVSNSKTQKDFIDAECKKRNLTNIQVITQNAANLNLGDDKFDRVVSVEMLEHFKNYEKMFANISQYLKDDGLLFIHIFTHSIGAYHFEVKDQSDWMSKYFFSGGQMPADQLFYYFQNDLEIKDHWKVNGSHYQKTSRAWLDNMDIHKDEIIDIFSRTYGVDNAMKWFRYWRLFFIACEELFGFQKGEEWIVSHYLMSKKES